MRGCRSSGGCRWSGAGGRVPVLRPSWRKQVRPTGTSSTGFQESKQPASPAPPAGHSQWPSVEKLLAVGNMWRRVARSAPALQEFGCPIILLMVELDCQVSLTGVWKLLSAGAQAPIARLSNRHFGAAGGGESAGRPRAGGSRDSSDKSSPQSKHAQKPVRISRSPCLAVCRGRPLGSCGQ